MLLLNFRFLTGKAERMAFPSGGSLLVQAGLWPFTAERPSDIGNTL
jgi:hypothetical protein